MGNLNQKFLTDNQGKKVGVLMSMDYYNQIMEQLEDLLDFKVKESTNRAPAPQAE